MSYPFASMGKTLICALGAPEVISVSRPGAGSYVNGRWVSGSPQTLSIDAVVNPMNPRDVEQLPENERTKQSIEIFTVSRLYAGDAKTQVEGDTVTWDGRTWRVLVLENWATQAGYYRALAVREDE